MPKYDDEFRAKLTAALEALTEPTIDPAKHISVELGEYDRENRAVTMHLTAKTPLGVEMIERMRGEDDV